MIYNMRGAFNPIAVYLPGDMYERDGVTFAVSRGGVHTPVAVPGDESLRGPRGFDGANGRDGADGRNGKDGHDGAHGRDGRDGKDGVDGKRGPRGFDGETGVITKKIIPETVVTGAAAANIVAGNVLYATSSGMELAQANSELTALAVGIATTSAGVGSDVKYAVSGPVTVPEWNLEPGRAYYLSPAVAGGMTTTFPNAVGNYVVILGIALTPNTLKVDIHFALVIGS